MELKHFFDKDTFTLTYVVYDTATKDAVIIDPVLDYDAASATISSHSLRELVLFIGEQQLRPKLILETHAHADHLSSARRLKEMYPEAQMAIGRNIIAVQQTFKEVFDLDHLRADGSHFDLLLDHHGTYTFGSISFKVYFTPGHTQACVCYHFGNELFVGDLIFMPDYGTGRCDFPGGSAEQMYESIVKQVYSLPDTTRVYVGHDYMPGGRELKFQTTVAELKQANIHIRPDTPKRDFVLFRNSRDKTLSPPRLLFPSVQFNIEAGQLTPANEQGQYFFKIPVKLAE